MTSELWYLALQTWLGSYDTLKPLITIAQMHLINCFEVIILPFFKIKNVSMQGNSFLSKLCYPGVWFTDTIRAMLDSFFYLLIFQAISLFAIPKVSK